MRKILLTLFTLTFMSCEMTDLSIIYPRLLNGDRSIFSISFDKLIKEDYTMTNLTVSYSSDKDLKKGNVDNMLIFIQPVYENNPIDFSEYPQGIPIMMYGKYSYPRYTDENGMFCFYSYKPIMVITNGDMELSNSYDYINNVTLPIAPKSIGTEFDINKCSFDVKYIDDDGNFRNLKEFFER